MYYYAAKPQPPLSMFLERLQKDKNPKQMLHDSAPTLLSIPGMLKNLTKINNVYIAHFSVNMPW